MNTARLIAWMVLPVVALVAVGMIAIWLFEAILGIVFYLVVGALVGAGGLYLYQRAKRAVGPGTRTRMRLDAASQTYRERSR
jgi:hypothetical protein